MDEAEKLAYGQKLKAMRIAAGLAQRELGEACGFEGKVATTIVQHWEHGRRIPTTETLRSLATALRVPIDQVVP